MDKSLENGYSKNTFLETNALREVFDIGGLKDNAGNLAGCQRSATSICGDRDSFSASWCLVYYVKNEVYGFINMG